MRAFDEERTASTPGVRGEHPTRQDLERFMRGDLPPAQTMAIVRHLLTGCPQCGQMTRRLWGLGERRRPDKFLLAEMRRQAEERRAGRDLSPRRGQL